MSLWRRVQSHTHSTVAKEATILTCATMRSVTLAKIMRRLLRFRNRAQTLGVPSITEPHALKMKPTSISSQWTLGFPHLPYFFDVKLFNLHAASCPRNIKDAYEQLESQKKINYEQRIIDVEHSAFNPLVFACIGGAGPSASKVMSRLALKISEKGYDSYSDTIMSIRTKISFALLLSSVLCLRGCRALKRQIDHDESSIATTVQEGRLS